MKIGDVYYLVYGSVITKEWPGAGWELIAQFISLDAMELALSNNEDYPSDRDYRVVKCEVIR